jgi:phospholipid/cholesterol/gamma-HCH transport system substrate-binding protein
VTGRLARLSAVAAVAVVLFTSGCGVLSGGLRGVDLPGGADLGDTPYQLTVEFTDVVDLVPQSLVKVADVPVGTVTDIAVGPDWTAQVTVLVNGDVALPPNVQARLRTTSLLGEKFVELLAPKDPAEGRIADGATIPLLRTSRAAEVEEVLGALSLLLNGGGVAQIRTIANELNQALTGNEPEIRALLDDLDTLVGALDDHKSEITRALDEINRLSITLRDRRGQITTALKDLSPGLRELEDQRGKLVDMLQALDRLSGVATHVINRSRDDVVADLELLRPILAKLVESGPDLVNSLELLPSFPFPDAAIDAIGGSDYTNLHIKADLDLSRVLENMIRAGGPFPRVDGLPPTAELLGPLLGPTAPAPPDFPLLDEGGPLPLPGQDEQPPASGSPEPTDEPGDTPDPEPGGERGLLDGLFGGNG